MSFLVRLLFVVSVVFTLTMAFVWFVDWLFQDRDEMDEAEEDFWDRVEVGDEWIP